MNPENFFPKAILNKSLFEMENENFRLNFKDDILTVKRFDLGGQTFFRITFPGKLPVLDDNEEQLLNDWKIIDSFCW